MRLHVPVPLRWADLDAYGHVNNVAMLRILEEARIAAFWRHPEAVDTPVLPTAVLDAGPRAQTHTLVARTEIEYLAPLAYRREPVTVQMWVGRIGGASLDVCYEITAEGDVDVDTGPGATEVFAHAETTIVLLDAASGRPRRVSPSEREVWARYLGEPVRMRRRR